MLWGSGGGDLRGDGEAGTSRPVAAGAVTAGCRASCSPAQPATRLRHCRGGHGQWRHWKFYITSKLILAIIFELDLQFLTAATCHQLLVVCGPGTGGGNPG